MLYKIIFKLSLCVLLLTVASCSSPEAVTSQPTVPPKAEQPVAGNADLLASVGDSKFTMQHIEWMQPGIDKTRIAGIANWWVENELLYREAQKRGLLKDKKTKFLADLSAKKAFAHQLRAKVRDEVEITDEMISAYYEKNKNTDRRLKRPGSFNFTHIRTKTLEDANKALERIKAGEDISALAKKLSVHGDARAGGAALKHAYDRVKRQFGNKFFQALSAAEEGQLIGPIEVRKDAYEIARLDSKTEPTILSLEKAKSQIKSKLLREEQRKAFKTLLESLEQENADIIVKSPLVTEVPKPANRKRPPPIRRGVLKKE